MRIVAIDTETTGLDRFKEDAKPFLFLSYDGKKYVASRSVEDIYDDLRDETVLKVFHNTKFDLHMLAEMGVKEVKGSVHDTQIAMMMIDENKYHRKQSALKYQARTILGEETNEEEELDKWFKEHKVKKEDRRYDMLPDDIVIPYGKKDVLYTLRLYQYAVPILKEQGLWELYLKRCRLPEVLMHIEERGVLVDTKKAARVYKDLNNKMLVIEKKIATSYKGLNVRSPKQLGVIFKKEVKDPIYNEKKNLVTDADALKIYQKDSKLAKHLVTYRGYTKLRDTYCAGLINAADKDNVVHCNFNQLGARTGRFSSSNPNLQNIPQLSDDETDLHTNLIRSFFLVRPGHTNFYLDYSQIEYRIAVDYADDEEMLKRINKGEDVHTIQGQRIAGKKPEAKLTKKERQLGKTMNFASLYGCLLYTSPSPRD